MENVLIFAAVMGVVVGFIAVVSKTAIGQAVVEQIRGQAAGGHDPEAQARLDAMEEELAHLREQLIETQERVDFAERLLAKVRDAKQIGPGT
jgi:hypothetical protein